MLKLMVIDDSQCKKDLDCFVKTHQQALHVNISSTAFLEKFENWLSKITHETNKIALSTNNAINLVDVNDIIRCESERNYTKLFFTDQKHLTLSKTLHQFELIFKHKGFIRIHKTHLINLNFIDQYIRKEGGSVLMKDGVFFPLQCVKKKSY
jgi:two-component system LytT family response regulator